MKNQLICHIMQDFTNEIATVKTKRHKKEFNWKQRIWAIPDVNDKAIIIDKKGVGHLFVDVNESDGIVRILQPRKDNIIDDKCSQCGGKISIDAMNVRNLVKRKTIDTFWGIDNTYFLLLIVIMIFAIGGLGFAFYLYGENSELRNQITILTANTAKIVLGGLFV